MHVVLEKARKAAGISGFTKNYPDNPKQRGCGFWAAFMGSISNDLGMMDASELKSSRTSAADIRNWATRVDELEVEIAGLRKMLQERGIEVIRHQQNWSVEQGVEALKTIAG